MKRSLFHCDRLEAPVAIQKQRIKTYFDLLQDANALSRQLSPSRYVMNLCRDRYHFLVGFVAAMMQGKTSIFPSSNLKLAIQQVSQQYPDCHYVVDAAHPELNQHALTHIDSVSRLEETLTSIPKIDANHTAAIMYTSGTTGQPKAVPLKWEMLVSLAHTMAKRCKITLGDALTIVGTVPSQHMFGLEHTVVLPLQLGLCVHTQQAYFPEDLRLILQECSTSVLLATTPMHLRAYVKAALNYPKVDYILSSTAPLPAQLATSAEACFVAEVIEIYGSTESGVIATRRTAQEESWQLPADRSLHNSHRGWLLKAHYLQEDLLLNDNIEWLGNHQFILKGRRDNIVKIAGKRISPDVFNECLLAIEGVLDGCFYFPQDPTTRHTQKPIAFVVAPELSINDIINKLSKQLDSVFLPRPIYKVDQLPRLETGKLTKAAMRELLNQQQCAVA